MQKQYLIPEGYLNNAFNLDISKVEEYIKYGDIFQGIVQKCDMCYNLYVNLGNGITGIIPRTEVEAINVDESGLPKVNLCTGKVNKYVQFKIKQIDSDNNILLSRRDVQRETLKWIEHNLKVGDKIKGIVKSIKPYGAFIEIGGGVVGLVHIEDLSIARIRTPFERLKIGQNVKVVVKSINKEEGKILLSYKETLGTWEENVNNFFIGMKTQGIIRETEKNKNGIFIELTPNLLGMAEYQEGLEYGKKIDVYIRKIDKDRKKIKLNII